MTDETPTLALTAARIRAMADELMAFTANSKAPLRRTHAYAAVARMLGYRSLQAMKAALPDGEALHEGENGLAAKPYDDCTYITEKEVIAVATIGEWRDDEELEDEGITTPAAGWPVVIASPGESSLLIEVTAPAGRASFMIEGDAGLTRIHAYPPDAESGWAQDDVVCSMRLDAKGAWVEAGHYPGHGPSGDVLYDEQGAHFDRRHPTAITAQS